MQIHVFGGQSRSFGVVAMKKLLHVLFDTFVLAEISRHPHIPAVFLVQMKQVCLLNVKIFFPLKENNDPKVPEWISF